MKIDKRNPTHWLCLIAFTLQSAFGLALRLFNRKTAVILYGHKLNGNLLAIYRECPNAIFLTMDLNYCRTLQAQGVRCQWACSMGAASLLARAKAVLSDHGLHSLETFLPTYRKAGLKFFDVWHGIPFKGFDADDFRLQHQYDATWVASPLIRELYVHRFGFNPNQVVITGYARTDVLVKPESSNTDIRERLGVPETGAVILFAPTWAQDTAGRSLYPFGQSESVFLTALASFAQQYRATVILRTHLNSRACKAQDYPNIQRMPSSDWPDTESILQITDVLICDWSSIAFDFLLLNKPTLFLDIPPPFSKGLSLGGEYRFGPIIGSLPMLIKELEFAIQRPDEYRRQHFEKQQSVKKKVYEGWADGLATQRCLDYLKNTTLTKK